MKSLGASSYDHEIKLCVHTHCFPYALLYDAQSTRLILGLFSLFTFLSFLFHMGG